MALDKFLKLAFPPAAAPPATGAPAAAAPAKPPVPGAKPTNTFPPATVKPSTTPQTDPKGKKAELKKQNFKADEAGKATDGTTKYTPFRVRTVDLQRGDIISQEDSDTPTHVVMRSADGAGLLGAKNLASGNLEDKWKSKDDKTTVRRWQPTGSVVDPPAWETPNRTYTIGGNI